MKKYEIDVVTETLSFDESLQTLTEFVTGVKIVEIEMAGRGSGWPTIVIEVPNESLNKLKMWYEGAEDVLDCELTEEDWEAMEC
jgi:hypothetical protein